MGSRPRQGDRPMPRRSPSSAKQRDKRQSVRTRLLQPARLAWDGGLADCLIYDLSAAGAQVRLAGPPEAGAAVRLQIPLMGALDCEIVWRREDAAGLCFRDTPASVARVLGGLASPYRAAS